MTVGPPEIAQVVLEIESPVGKGGIVKQVLGVPPTITGVAVFMAAPFVREKGVPEYVIDVGATIPLEMVIVIFAVVLPAELEASIVKVLASNAE